MKMSFAVFDETGDELRTEAKFIEEVVRSAAAIDFEKAAMSISVVFAIVAIMGEANGTGSKEEWLEAMIEKARNQLKNSINLNEISKGQLQ